MDNLEEKLGAILSDPDMMQKIQATPAASSQPNPVPSIDPALIQKLSGFAGQTGIDKNQQALLHALCPYISQNKVTKLEKAMRAAKIARLASGFLGSGGLQLLSGR